MFDTVHQGRTIERSEEGVSRSETRLGTLSELTEYLDSLSIGNGSGGMQIRRARLSQVAGPTWKCEIESSNGNDGSFGGAAGPSDAYGTKSAQLSCGMLSLPLEMHSNYRTRWNYYLAGCDIVAATSEKKDGKEVVKYTVTESAALPDWHETATTTSLTAEVSLKYRWVKSPSELPVGATRDGRVWRILAEPTKPGVNNFDLATYQVTESAAYLTPSAAGRFVRGRLNKIIKPNTTFGITGGNWKVDSASIGWDGKKWKATLTYTLSGNNSGWDSDLYEVGRAVQKEELFGENAKAWAQKIRDQLKQENQDE